MKNIEGVSKAKRSRALFVFALDYASTERTIFICDKIRGKFEKKVCFRKIYQRQFVFLARKKIIFCIFILPPHFIVIALYAESPSQIETSTTNT